MKCEMPGHLGWGGIDGGAPACQIRKTAISTPIIYVLYVASATSTAGGSAYSIKSSIISIVSSSKFKSR